MGNSTPTCTHTHVTPVPALTGMGLYGYGCGLPVTSHHTATSSLTTPTLNQCPRQCQGRHPQQQLQLRLSMQMTTTAMGSWHSKRWKLTRVGMGRHAYPLQ